MRKEIRNEIEMQQSNYGRTDTCVNKTSTQMNGHVEVVLSNLSQFLPVFAIDKEKLFHPVVCEHEHLEA